MRTYSNSQETTMTKKRKTPKDKLLSSAAHIQPRPMTHTKTSPDDAATDNVTTDDAATENATSEAALVDEAVLEFNSIGHSQVKDIFKFGWLLKDKKEVLSKAA